MIIKQDLNVKRSLRSLEDGTNEKTHVCNYDLQRYDKELVVGLTQGDLCLCGYDYAKKLLANCELLLLGDGGDIIHIYKLMSSRGLIVGRCRVSYQGVLGLNIWVLCTIFLSASL